MPKIDLSAVDERSGAEMPTGVSEGGRDDALMRWACSLQALGVADEEMEAMCLEANATFSPPLPEWQVLKCVRSAQRYPKGKSSSTGRAHAAPRRDPPPRLHRVGRPERLPSWRGVSPETQARAWVRSCFDPLDVVCVTWDMGAGAAGECHAYAGQLADPHDPLVPRLLAKAGDGGLWACANPLDGSGRRRAENVAAYRNLLVECDELPLHEQMERICALVMNGGGVGPDARAVTWSGGKSMHALVRADAPDAEAYAEFARRTYAMCAANGLPVDAKCSNPNRLTRVPGAMRGGEMQALAFAREPARCWDGTPSTWGVPTGE